MKRWLPVILLLLVLIGCGDIDFDTSFLFGCEDGSVSPASDPQYLCVMWEDNDDFESFPPYFVTSGSNWDMFTFTDAEPGVDIMSDFYNAIKDVDNDLATQARDSLNEHFWGNDVPCNGVATSHDLCVPIKDSIPRNTFIGVVKSEVSLKTNQEAELVSELPDPIPLMIQCTYNQEGDIFIQKIEEKNTDKIYLNIYMCTEDRWKNVLDLDDDDNDGTPNNLDCNDKDTSMYFPTQLLVKTDANGITEWGIEKKNVCGDGTPNFCPVSYNRYTKLVTYDENDVYTPDSAVETPGFFEILVEAAQSHYLMDSTQKADKWDELVWSVSDDCDFDSEACISNCNKLQGNCDHLLISNSYDGSIGDNSSQSSIVYEDFNSLSEAGYCCGNDPTDNGQIITNDDGSFLCLNTNQEFVGIKDDESFTDICSNDWCWINSESLPYETLTIKNEGEVYDTVSNLAEWNACQTEGPLPVPAAYEIPAEYDNVAVSRFSCFMAGDVGIWGECVSDTSIATSHKSRVRTAGASKLYLGNGSTIRLDAFVKGDIDNIDYGGTSEAGLQYGLDLTDYDFLEFYVKFNNLENKYPVDLILSIQLMEQSDGRFPEVYSNNVLGYSDFPYLVEGEYVRVRVPIGNWQDIFYLDFRSSMESLDFEIKNVQAIRTNEDELYCSGQQAQYAENNAFLQGIDLNSDSDADISSVDVCKQLYGEDAWLGYYYGSANEVEEEFAACCGDKPNEYYAGASEDLDGRGCFNSEVMYDGERAANVQFTVNYGITDYNFYSNAITIAESEFYIFDSGCGLYKLNHGYSGAEDLGVDYESLWHYGCQSDDDIWVNALVGDGEYSWSETDVDGREVLSEHNFLISNDIFKQDFDLPELPEHLYWYSVNERKKLTRIDNDFQPTNLTLAVVAEYKDYQVSESTSTENITYVVPCIEDECVYALPGQPPYEITNDFPGLYDLYFVVGSNEEEQYLITEQNQNFSVYGNILARRVSKNVLMTNETFYSCEVPEYYFDTGYEMYGEQGSRCDVQNGYVCSPQDADSLINTWSNLDLEKIGYTEVTEYVDGMEFQPRTCGAQDPCDVNDLEHSVKPVPGRNLVPNADYYVSDGNNIVGWIMYDGQFDTDSLPYRESNSVTVPSGFLFKSTKIAVTDTTYSVSASTNCPYNTYGYTKEGSRVSLGNTFIGNSFEYVELVFEGTDCTVSNPYLSVGPSLSEDFDDRYPFRSGAACCPEGACWNGYICVENMASYTFMTENVGEENFRCIDGDWYNLPPLYDWHGDEVGYCEREGQCFVTSSLSEGIMENASYTDFYNGEYPACINDGEFIFDHLCQDGEWSSRTKFVASSLLNYADGDDHILYCTDVRDALLDYKEDGYNYANYIEGESTTVVETTVGLDEAFDGTLIGNTTLSICYPELTVSETGRRLVPDNENTCVNNVCTVRYKDGEWSTMWGTSVNIDPRDSQSLFVPLGIAGSETESFCNGDNETWVECNDNIWFYDAMDSMIYTKDEIGMSQTVTESIVSFLSDLFGTDQIEESEDYLEEASNFNKVYIAHVDDYTVRAIEEIDGDQETIVAEYTGFETPVCDYVYNVNPSMVYVEQWPAVPEFLVNCTSDEDVSTVVTGTNRDFWWPQLTGMLRIE